MYIYLFTLLYISIYIYMYVCMYVYIYMYSLQTLSARICSGLSSLPVQTDVSWPRLAALQLLLMIYIYILHYLKDPKPWELWYIPSYG